MTNGNSADFSQWAADYGFTDEQTDVHQYALRVARDAWDAALKYAAPTPERAQDDESITETPCHKEIGNRRIPKIKPRKINLDVDDYGPVDRAQESED